MGLRTSRNNGHIHHYNLGARTTSVDNGHNHLLIMGSTVTSLNQGHRHSLINVNDGIVGI